MSNAFERFEQINHHFSRDGAYQLRDFIFARSEELLRRGDEARNAISSVPELRVYNRKMKEAFLEGLGGLPESSCPLNARVTGKLDMGSFVMEQILLQVRPNAYMSSSLYLPKDIETPAPAILFIPGHSENGRMYARYQMVCQTLVRAGLIVFAIDPVGQGERSDFFDPESGRYLIDQAWPDHDACGVSSLATGRAIESYFISDQLRAIDYMMTRPEIDGTRIGVTGVSGGGTQTSAMMICDDRIAAAIPGAFLSNRRELLYSNLQQDTEQVWPGMMGFGLDYVNTLLCMTPRPVSILAETCDIFPVEGARQIHEEARRFYAMFGKEDSMCLHEEQTIHGYTLSMATYSAAFFTEIFYGKPRYVSNEDIEPLADSKMYATKTGNIVGEIPDARTVMDEVRGHATALRERRQALDPETRLERARSWLREKVYHDRQPVDYVTRVYNATYSNDWTVDDGYVATGCSWWTQKRLFSYGTLIRAEKNVQEKRLPTVIAIWTDGTKRISAHETWIRTQCDAGKQVLVLDVPGTGSIEQHPMLRSDQFGYKDDYGAMYRLCSDLLYMGDSMAAMRCYDVLRAIGMLKDQFGIPAEEVALYCDDEEGIYGVMAGFLNEQVAMSYGPALLHSVEREIMGQKVPVYHNTLTFILPGMLEYFDYEELMR